MKKISIMLAVLLVFGLDFAVGQSNSNSLIGTWTGNSLLGEVSFTFAADNTVTMRMMGYTISGTYAETRNNITMDFSVGQLGLLPSGNTLQARRNGNNLIIDGAVYTKSTQPSGPQTAAEYGERGAEYLEEDDYDRAIADFTQAIRLDPNEAVWYSLRGVAYFSKGDYDRAIADCNQAIRLNPNDARLYYIRGLAYINKGDYDRAIADLTEAIRLDPNNDVARRVRGDAYRLKGDLDRAMADYTSVINRNNNAPGSLTGRGLVYLARRDYNRAITDFEAALRIDSNNTEARNGLNEARRLRGN